MKIALAQINPRLGDFNQNAQLIQKNIEVAEEQNIDLLVFPELALCGYPPRDLLDFSDFHEKNDKALSELSRYARSVTVVLGCTRRNEKQGAPFFNSAAIIQKQKIIAYADKQLLPTYDVFEERRHFEPGDRTRTIEIGGKKIALSICEDIWNFEGFNPRLYAHDPLAVLVKNPVDILVNLSASPFHVGKPELREKLLTKISTKVKAPVLFCNLWGANDELIFDGASSVTSKDGSLRARAKSFSDDLLLWNSEASTDARIEAPLEEMESLHRALVTGISDYFRKTGFKAACLGVSGGIDSAVVASLAVDALGKGNVVGVCLPTRHTSKESLDDAQKLCENLEIEHRVFGMDTFYQLFQNLWKEWFHSQPRSLTLENFQPRMRMTLLMALANEKGALLLNTSNKSELAAGYATQYGDATGALSVLGDLTKGQVYALARFINERHARIPRSTMERPPTAELREGQLDQDTLPPYEQLDPLVQQSVVERLSKSEWKGGASEKDRENYWSQHVRTEYKRKQFPPILRVSAGAFGIGWKVPLTALR